MKWRSFPFVDYPRRSIFLVLFIILFTAGVYFNFSLFWTIFCTSILILNLLHYFLPTYYYMDENGVTIKGIVMNKRKEWSYFHSYYPDKNGVLLSPFDKPSRLENFRGVYIRFNNNKDEVIAFVKKYINGK